MFKGVLASIVKFSGVRWGQQSNFVVQIWLKDVAYISIYKTISISGCFYKSGKTMILNMAIAIYVLKNKVFFIPCTEYHQYM